MPVRTEKERAPMIERMRLVEVCLNSANRPLLVSEVGELTGLSTHHARAALRALCEGGAATSEEDAHIDRRRFEATGKAYDVRAAAAEHKRQAKQNHYTEPGGTVNEDKIPGVPGGRRIRFGRDYKIGQGQSTAVHLTAGSILNAIY